MVFILLLRPYLVHDVKILVFNRFNLKGTLKFKVFQMNDNIVTTTLTIYTCRMGYATLWVSEVLEYKDIIFERVPIKNGTHFI